MVYHVHLLKHGEVDDVLDVVIFIFNLISPEVDDTIIFRKILTPLKSEKIYMTIKFYESILSQRSPKVFP